MAHWWGQVRTKLSQEDWGNRGNWPSDIQELLHRKYAPSEDSRGSSRTTSNTCWNAAGVLQTKHYLASVVYFFWPSPFLNQLLKGFGNLGSPRWFGLIPGEAELIFSLLPDTFFLKWWVWWLAYLFLHFVTSIHLSIHFLYFQWMPTMCQALR